MQIKSTQKSNSSGFTLLELSIVFIVYGLFLLAFILGLRVYIETYNHNRVNANLENAKAALSYFLAETTRLPCPANPALNQGDLGYGQEDCSIAPVEGARDVDGDGNNENVLIGTLPAYGFISPDGAPGGETRSLRSYLNQQSLAGNEMKDPWNTEFTYAVTQSMTLAAPDFSSGVIQIVDEWGRDTGGTDSDVQFVVVSHGEDSIAGCEIALGASLVSMAEEENCDGDSVFSIALRSKGDTDHYDDYLVYERSRSRGVWANSRELDNTTSITNVYYIDQGKVFIGDAALYNQNDTDDLKLDVGGDIVFDTMAGADLICDDPNDPQTCIRPESLFTNQNGNNAHNLGGTFNCDPGFYMKSVEINADNKLEPDCQPLQFSYTSGQTCPTGQFLNGIYTNGDIACTEAPQP